MAGPRHTGHKPTFFPSQACLLAFWVIGCNRWTWLSRILGTEPPAEILQCQEAGFTPHPSRTHRAGTHGRHTACPWTLGTHCPLGAPGPQGAISRGPPHGEAERQEHRARGRPGQPPPQALPQVCELSWLEARASGADRSLIGLVSIPGSPAPPSQDWHVQHRWTFKGQKAEGTVGLSAKRIEAEWLRILGLITSIFPPGGPGKAHLTGGLSARFTVLQWAGRSNFPPPGPLPAQLPVHTSCFSSGGWSPQSPGLGSS